MTSTEVKADKNKISQKAEYEEILEAEKIKERDPRYLALKEKLASESQKQTNSYYFHPCQNDENTFTYLSSDKVHEIDVEIDLSSNTCQLNIISLDPSKKRTFINLLLSIQCLLNKEHITTVYQSVTLIDWEHIKDHFTLDRIVRNPYNPFVICHSDIKTFVSAITKSMGMDLKSHLDK